MAEQRFSDDEIAERLCAAAEMVPDLWTQGTLYVTPDGFQHADAIDGELLDRHDCGTLFCAEGLVRLVLDEWSVIHQNQPDFFVAVRAIQLAVGLPAAVPLWGWNDDEERTKQEVSKAFMDAAEILRSTGAV